MWIQILPLLLLAVAPQWEVVDEENGCTFYAGTVDGVNSGRAECHWPISPDALHKRLAVFEQHADYFSFVVSSTPHDASQGLYHQVHSAPFISDREIVLAMTSETVPDGTRYSWQRAALPYAPTGDRVIPAVDTGYWQVQASPDGGSKVTLQLSYDPSGNVPGFVTRWFQNDGLKTYVGDLRAFMAG